MFPLSIKENLVSDASVAYVESRARISFLMFCPIPPVWNCTTQLSVLLVASATWWGTCRFGRLKGLRKIEEQHRFCPQSQIWSIFVTWSIMNVTPKSPIHVLNDIGHTGATPQSPIIHEPPEPSFDLHLRGCPSGNISFR